MKKLVLVFVFISSILFTSNAQETVAKIKFGEAEQAFANNDFQATITKLDDVEKILNQSNSKILHLRIKAEYGILQKDPWASYSPIEKLRSQCAFYLKEYDGKAPMDKYMEVYNVSEALKTYPASSEEFNKAKEEKIRKEEETEKIQRDTKNKQIIEEMTQRIKAKKKDHDAYHRRGKAKFGLGDMTGALEDLNMAISLGNTNDTYYFVRGYIYHFMNEYEKAVDDFTISIRIDSQYVNYYYWRGYTFYYMNQHSKAIDDFSKFLQLNPENGKIYFLRGYSFYCMKEYSKAVDDFTNAISVDPQYATAYFYRGKIHYVFFNDKLKGESDFKKVLELGENSSNEVVFANYYLGNKKKAFKLMLDNIASGDMEAHWSYNLACLYSLDLNKEEALNYLKTALEKGNYAQWAQQDEDLEFVRNTPEFKALIEQYDNSK